MMVVDVTDPANPYIRSRLKTQTNTHTVSCLEETNCQYAYTAGRNGQFSVVDLSDLDNPREAGVFTSPAGGPNARFKRGAGHKWNFDDAGYGVHTAAAARSSTSPTRPRHGWWPRRTPTASPARGTTSSITTRPARTPSSSTPGRLPT